VDNTDKSAKGLWALGGSERAVRQWCVIIAPVDLQDLFDLGTRIRVNHV
jgi:hypothetical protein